ncbi:hypothetical protein NQ318_019092 [Aromia moschata]|uniref:Uncharacterized protein n=1 Tax=Aromia moschata TaxID=1265417 RepID=A0AAV8Y7T7_9CUCU|nr:hypothetical protein NQ318_019092 [Aromia moschata]
MEKWKQFDPRGGINQFNYNDEYFQQHEGTAMGNSLSPFIANIVMSKETEANDKFEYFPRVWFSLILCEHVRLIADFKQLVLMSYTELKRKLGYVENQSKLRDLDLGFGFSASKTFVKIYSGFWVKILSASVKYIGHVGEDFKGSYNFKHKSNEENYKRNVTLHMQSLEGQEKLYFRFYNFVHFQRGVKYRVTVLRGQRFISAVVSGKETGDVKDLPKLGRPKITQDKKIDIVLSMEENPQSTSTLVASENKIVQELNEDDPDRRLQFFCETMMNLCQTNPNLYQQTLFSDEATKHILNIRRN